MLREMTVRDFVIVQAARVRFERGFHVLTGETGAGKSILIDALALALGNRASADIVRAGAKRAEITLVLQPSSGARQWLDEQDLDQDDDALILRRIVDQQGKSRAYINGTPVTIAQLREIGQTLVDIHGQHAHQSLVRTDAQRDLLDAHLQLGQQRQALRQAWQHWQELLERVALATEDAQALAERLQTLTWQVQELDELAPKPGQWQQILEQHTRLSNGQALLDGAAQALALLDDEDNGAQRAVARAIMQVQQASRHDAHLNDILQSLESADIALAQARSDLSRYVDDLDLDPEQLEQLDQRMQALFGAARKYRCEPEQLPELHQELTEALASLNADQDLDALRAQEASARQSYDRLAQTLSQARQKGAKGLAKAVTQQMQSLGMAGGQFVVTIEPGTPGPHGADRVSFLVSGHPGVAPGPLAKVASGGELSRVSLALSVIASQATETATLVFDEVDSGVSGAVAEMVGRLLRQLGQSHQVLCVTHLPQVAACAEHHFKVNKGQGEDGLPTSSIEPLDHEGRIEAVAQLLGGVNMTETTREHARELLKSNAPD